MYVCVCVCVCASCVRRACVCTCVQEKETKTARLRDGGKNVALITTTLTSKKALFHNDKVSYHWRELPQVSFWSRQKFCGEFCRDKHVFVATNMFFVATKMILVAAPANDSFPAPTAKCLWISIYSSLGYRLNSVIKGLEG